MALCPINTIDSNVTGLWVAEETCPRQLPVTPAWYAQEPNSYSDFGGEVTSMTREYIDPSRQNQKGTAVDESASGGWTQDVTKSNMTRLLQGFFFADAREPATTKPLNGAQVPVTAVTLVSSTHRYAISNYASFMVNDLIYRSGFSLAANNGLVGVSAVSPSTIGCPSATSGAPETPPATAVIDVVGIEFASGDVAVSFASGVCALTSTAYNFSTNPNLFAGQWIYLGSDVLANRFANNNGYARIKTINANSLILDETTWTPVTESGTGKTIRLFFGTTVKNETTPKKRTYNIERTLGLSSEGLVQAEYLEGAIANEMTLTIPTGDKVTAELGFVAARATERTGTTTPVSDIRKTGTRIAALKQRAINTSNDVYRMKMSILDPANPNPTALFAFLTEGTISINNNASQHKAVGILGSLDTTVGTFNVKGTATAYFTSPLAKRAMRNLSDVSINFILARDNWGQIWDIPLITIDGGRINVEKDAPITIPLEATGAENANGYTASYTEFKYLPTVAMPVQPA